jgi:hypothetical protein
LEIIMTIQTKFRKDNFTNLIDSLNRVINQRKKIINDFIDNANRTCADELNNVIDYPKKDIVEIYGRVANGIKEYNFAFDPILTYGVSKFGEATFVFDRSKTFKEIELSFPERFKSFTRIAFDNDNISIAFLDDTNRLLYQRGVIDANESSYKPTNPDTIQKLQNYEKKIEVLIINIDSYLRKIVPLIKAKNDQLNLQCKTILDKKRQRDENAGEESRKAEDKRHRDFYDTQGGRLPDNRIAVEHIAHIKKLLAEAITVSTSEITNEIREGFLNKGWREINSYDKTHGSHCYRNNHDMYAYVNEATLTVTYIDAMTDDIESQHTFNSVQELINSTEQA